MSDEIFAKLAQVLNKPVEQLRKEFEEDYSKAWIHQDDQFKDVDDEAKRQYWLRVFYVKKLQTLRYNEQSYTILPVGYSSVRTTKDNRRMRTLYALIEKKLCKILFFDDLVDKLADITLFGVYNVFLSKGKDVYFATENTEFGEPEKIYDGAKVITTIAKKATLDTIDKCLSKIGKGGYVDDTDLYYIEGFIVRVFDGTREDYSEFHLIEVSDGTVVEETVTEQGIVKPTTITVWLPEKCEWDATSQVIVCGSISLSDSTPTMNAICVVPVFPFVKRRGD